MKCPECKTTQRHSSGMTCNKCGRKYVLDPKADGLSDGKFLAAVKRASQSDTLFYTENQLYEALVRPKKRLFGCQVPAAGLLVFLVLGLLSGFFLPQALIVVFFLGFFYFIAFLITLVQPPATRDTFHDALRKWKSRAGMPSKLIQEPRLRNPPEGWTEQDIYDYGCERLLIVEHDLLVDLFVLNNFHSTERCLVVSIRGYPPYLVPLANRILQEQPELPVYLLHDSTFAGEQMANQLTRSPYHVTDHPVIDLGLNRDDVMKLKRLTPVGAKKLDYRVPVDLMAMAALQTALIASFAQQSSFGALIAQQQNAETADSGGFG